MESGNKNSGNVESGVVVANKRKLRGSDVILRFLALALSLAAAVVLGVDKETTTVAMTLVPTLPAVNVPVTAKWHYLSAFVFFVVSNSIACAYAAVSLLLKLANRSGKNGMDMMFVLVDLIMVALLFASVGAALAIGLMGYEGNSHVQWKKVCHVFDTYCDQVGVAIDGAPRVRVVAGKGTISRVWMSGAWECAGARGRGARCVLASKRGRDRSAWLGHDIID
ncbi:CASP-like protein 1E1 [Striga hermonthica]|uniref:CASP-like protein n=1 Tax=Striga hermonthica TaxID=68872 RepID=A0A9N7R2I1_STRHE|nr:CASP-like protein 1E1 [Striga hermonthica]